MKGKELTPYILRLQDIRAMVNRIDDMLKGTVNEQRRAHIMARRYILREELIKLSKELLSYSEQI